MKMSLKWLSKYTNVANYLRAPEKLAEILTNGGLEVEGIEDLSKALTRVVVGLILEKNKHPNADSLTLCTVDVGEGQPRRIVCGAKNHNQGDKVVVALPGAVLPGDFTIKVSKIRGEESQGMLCSDKELGLSGDHQGIKILPADAPIGMPFSQYAKRDDVIFDIKVTPNRADCLSHFGLAREIASLTAEKYEFPLSPFNEGRESTRKLIKLTVEDDRCSRYAGRVVLGVKIGPSPEWLKRSLESVGLRTINNVVDVTNFVMLELGQPLHAFDTSQLEGAQIIVRKAKAGEEFKTLTDIDLKLDGSELVIADTQKPVALAGVIGGLGSGVTEKTRDVFIESAYFLPAAVRRASRRHGLDTDSSYRFMRGVDIDAVNLGLNRACQLLSEIAGGTVCADSYDHYPRPLAKSRIELDLAFVSARLGITIDSVEAKRILERVGCDVSGSGGKLLVNPPPFRTDLRIPEDLGEELLRLKGFGQIPETLPQGTAAPTLDDVQFRLENTLVETLRGEGFSQAVNLSFVQSQFQSQFLGKERGQPSELGMDLSLPVVAIENPINLDLDVMRTSLLPSLARNMAHNVRHSLDQGALFEIAPVFSKKETPDLRQETRPFYEETHLGLIQWGEDEETWLKETKTPLFFKLKGALESLLEAWNFKSVKFEALTKVPNFLHPGQSAKISVEGKFVGFMGLLHPLVADLLEVKGTVAVSEINLKTLLIGQPRAVRSKAIPKFPSVKRDVAFLAPANLSAGEIATALLKAAGPLAKFCYPFDLYRGDKVGSDKKSVAFRIIYQDPQRTLSDEEINAMHQKSIGQVSQKLNLSIR